MYSNKYCGILLIFLLKVFIKSIFESVYRRRRYHLFWETIPYPPCPTPQLAWGFRCVGPGVSTPKREMRWHYAIVNGVPVYDRRSFDPNAIVYNMAPDAGGFLSQTISETPQSHQSNMNEDMSGNDAAAEKFSSNFDPNHWGFSMYNPNEGMGQYLGRITEASLSGPSSNHGQATHADSQDSYYQGQSGMTFNPNNFNDYLMSVGGGGVDGHPPVETPHSATHNFDPSKLNQDLFNYMSYSPSNINAEVIPSGMFPPESIQQHIPGNMNGFNTGQFATLTADTSNNNTDAQSTHHDHQTTSSSKFAYPHVTGVGSLGSSNAVSTGYVKLESQIGPAEPQQEHAFGTGHMSSTVNQTTVNSPHASGIGSLGPGIKGNQGQAGVVGVSHVHGIGGLGGTPSGESSDVGANIQVTGIGSLGANTFTQHGIKNGQHHYVQSTGGTSHLATQGPGTMVQRLGDTSGHATMPSEFLSNALQATGIGALGGSFFILNGGVDNMGTSSHGDGSLGNTDMVESNGGLGPTSHATGIGSLGDINLTQMGASLTGSTSHATGIGSLGNSDADQHLGQVGGTGHFPFGQHNGSTTGIATGHVTGIGGLGTGNQVGAAGGLGTGTQVGAAGGLGTGIQVGAAGGLGTGTQVGVAGGLGTGTLLGGTGGLGSGTEMASGIPIFTDNVNRNMTGSSPSQISVHAAGSLGASSLSQYGTSQNVQDIGGLPGLIALDTDGNTYSQKETADSRLSASPFSLSMDGALHATGIGSLGGGGMPSPWKSPDGEAIQIPTGQRQGTGYHLVEQNPQ